MKIIVDSAVQQVLDLVVRIVLIRHMSMDREVNANIAVQQV